MKKKLFLNTTDISNITGYSLRNSRNIMAFLKAERQLESFQMVSIFDFCSCFNLPLDVVFRYINSSDFKLLPIDEEAVRHQQTREQTDSSAKGRYLHSEDFEFLVHKKRIKKDNGVEGDDDHTTATGS